MIGVEDSVLEFETKNYEKTECYIHLQPASVEDVEGVSGLSRMRAYTRAYAHTHMRQCRKILHILHKLHILHTDGKREI
jgi:hypothetical protein